MKKYLNLLKKKNKRVIVGIETGNTPGRFGGALVEVSGNGDGTVLDLHGFKNYPLPKELVTTLNVMGKGSEFDSEEVAGVNFLILHHLSKLFQAVLDGVGRTSEEVDLIGLKCMEIGGRFFPSDPSILSETTGRVVASRFYIGIEDGTGGLLPVKESILRGLVGEMIDKFGLDSEVREAAAVALLASEALFHEDLTSVAGPGPGGGSSKITSLRAVQRLNKVAGDERSCLCGEFFFPG